MLVRFLFTLLNKTWRFEQPAFASPNALNEAVLFYVAGRTVWNSLADDLRDPELFTFSTGLGNTSPFTGHYTDR